MVRDGLKRLFLENIYGSWGDQIGEVVKLFLNLIINVICNLH